MAGITVSTKINSFVKIIYCSFIQFLLEEKGDEIRIQCVITNEIDCLTKNWPISVVWLKNKKLLEMKRELIKIQMSREMKDHNPLIMEDRIVVERDIKPKTSIEEESVKRNELLMENQSSRVATDISNPKDGKEDNQTETKEVAKTEDEKKNKALSIVSTSIKSHSRSRSHREGGYHHSHGHHSRQRHHRSRSSSRYDSHSRSRHRSRSKSHSASHSREAPKNTLGDIIKNVEKTVQCISISCVSCVASKSSIIPDFDLIEPKCAYGKDLYVGNIIEGSHPEDVIEFLNKAMLAANLNRWPGKPVIAWRVLPKFCFVSLRHEDEATNALNLDGIYFHGQRLKISESNRFC